MKTDELIALLATGIEPVDRWLFARRLVIGLLIALLGASLMTVMLFGVRSDLAQVAATPLFWGKLALPGALLIAALLVVIRLARPGLDVGLRWSGIGAPVLGVWAMALMVLSGVPEDQQLALIFGRTWRTCPFNIALLSIPGFFALFRALQALAPTQLRLAGGVAGLLASASATLAYCLHCPEMEVPFWGVWYVLGMAIPTLIGALLGPRWLRW
ncbi:DUF1109 domain-containing protein [Pseudomonas alkylphenolica]|uniref:DUF1109 domain-containing protein n=1 Tax=Pseudomonas alkylphenolica TaxID=237609 RepID=UPI0018D8D10E|nr:DUF1109 domain-containing protein [Pseudomonas alkylphenolica]MBH3427223.1 DUF1109 domain-containing protein [Pseudomonas alkylphenolica]